MAIEEIVVTPPRRSDFEPISFQAGRQPGGFGGAELAGALYPAERAAMEKLATKKTLPKTKTAPKLPTTVPDFLKPKPFYPIVPYVAPTDVIISTPSKLQIATRFASRLAAPLAAAEAVGRLGAAIAREVSRQALEEAWQQFEAVKPRPKDSPLRTIRVETEEKVVTPPKVTSFPAQQMEEIVITEPGPRPLTFAEPALSRAQMLGFQQDMLRNTYSSFQRELRTAPATSTRTRTRTDPLTQTIARVQTMTLAQPRETTRRSTLLGIGTGTAGALGLATTTGTGLGTGVLTTTVPITQSKLQQINPVGQRTKYCKPCPRKKKKRRTKCYRQLVKQARYESNDKISRWAEIDCQTGKTIKELI